MSVYRLSLEAAQSPPPGDGGGNDGSVLAGLTKFIPTETVTLYVVTVSLFSQIASTWTDFKSIYAYIFFLILTPVFLLLMYWARLPAASQWLEFKKWPIWKMAASSIAFAVWALAVPENGVVSGDAAGVLFAILAPIISSLLNLIDSIFNRT